MVFFSPYDQRGEDDRASEATDDDIAIRIDKVAGGCIGGRQTVFRAELLAVSQALEHIPIGRQGPPDTLNIVTDCQSVHKRWRRHERYDRGGAAVRTELGGVWADIREAQVRRNVILVLRWVPSHKTSAQAAEMGLRWWRVVANHAVDEAAGRFGLCCQLDAGVCARAAEATERERLVQERLVAIDGEVMARQGALPARARAVGQRPTPEERVEKRKRDSQHRLDEVSPTLVCVQCLRTTCTARLGAFLASECAGAPDPKRVKGNPSEVRSTLAEAGIARADDTHDLAVRGDVIICQVCGSFALGREESRLVLKGLAAPCGGAPSKAGSDALSRWRRGRHPSAKPPAGCR